MRARFLRVPKPAFFGIVEGDILGYEGATKFEVLWDVGPWSFEGASGGIEGGRGRQDTNQTRLGGKVEKVSRCTLPES